MAQLSNTVNATGLYDGVSTALTDTLVIQLVEGLTLTKTADKASWADGNLTYTLTIENSGESAYTGVTISDTLDITKIQLIDGTITINGTAAQAGDYTYNDTTGELTISPLTPLDVAAAGSAIITFQVEKNTP